MRNRFGDLPFLCQADPKIVLDLCRLRTEFQCFLQMLDRIISEAGKRGLVVGRRQARSRTQRDVRISEWR